MGNMKKLLNKPLKAFIVFTSIVLACSIPVYFFLIESIWINELDDHNAQIKKQIQARFNSPDEEALEKKIALWNEMQTTSHLSPATGPHADSVYIVEREITYNGVKELERFRGLSSGIRLNAKPYHLVIETNVEEVHETVLAVSLITCLFIGLLITGFILLNRQQSKRIWAPFTETLEKLKQFDLNSGEGIHLADTDILEFAELNTVLKKLIENNVRVYRQQKEFTQNASHELQTPLALLKSKVDLLIQDPSLTEEQRKIIESLDSSILRVTRINKNLLVLFGIENKGYESEEVHLNKVVESLVAAFSDFAESKGCSISLNVKDSVKLRANESLVEILISNLLSNTIRHGAPDSTIAVTLTDRTLIVSNEGSASLEKGHLFKRFIPATTSTPGTGLGLAIVKEIGDKYDWKISYSFTGKLHVFSVFF
jgi:signal transduction histidine kinase